MIYLTVFSVFLIAGTTLSIIDTPTWWIKVWDAARIQLTVLMSISFIAGLFIFPLNSILHLVVLFSLLMGVFYHTYYTYAFTPFHKLDLEKTTNRNHELSVLAFNVRISNDAYDELVELLKNQRPDIVLLTEVDKKWLEGIQAVESTYTNNILHPQDDGYGMALYSLYPIQNHTIKFLVEDNIPSIHAAIDVKGKTIQFIGMHPCPPAPWNDEEEKNIELLKVAKLVKENKGPTIVAGDLNDVGWSKITQIFKEKSGLKDPRIGRGFFNTYNAKIPFFRYPVDHIFVSDDFKLLNIERLDNLESDHYPVLLKANLE